MRYKITLQGSNGSWVYAITFGMNTPTAIEQAAEYSDTSTSADDLHGARHHVLFKDGKIVQIQLHDALRMFPHLDPERPDSIPMPATHVILFGQPPKPTLLLQFKEPDNRVAYAFSPNVFLVFQGDDLAELYVTDVALIEDAGQT